MRPRPANCRGKQMPQQTRQQPLLRQTAEPEMPPAEAPQVENQPSTENPPLYRLSAASADQQIRAGEALNWGQADLHLATGANLLLLNITFVTEEDAQAKWTLYAGEQARAELSCMCKAYQPTTLMLHTYLTTDNQAAVILKNTSDNALIVQQSSLNILSLDK